MDLWVCPSESGHTQKVGQLLCSHSRLLAASHRLSDLAPETLGLFTSFKAVCPQNCSDCYFWKWYLVWSFFCQIITVRDTQTGGHFHKASGVKQQQQGRASHVQTTRINLLLLHSLGVSGFQQVFVAEICSHSATGAIMGSNSDVGWWGLTHSLCFSSSQRCWLIEVRAKWENLFFMDLSLSFGVVVEFKNNTELIGQGLCPPPQPKVSQLLNFIVKHQVWGLQI